MPITTQVRLIGPVVQGYAEPIMVRILTEAMAVVGATGVHMIQQNLDGVLQHPTGFYRSQITSRVSLDKVSFDDNGVIYGPWLEGVGSRNKTTRFKGYFTFRKTSQELQHKAPDIVDAVVRAHMKELSL